jgi:hypothetical protein
MKVCVPCGGTPCDWLTYNKEIIRHLEDYMDNCKLTQTISNKQKSNGLRPENCLCCSRCYWGGPLGSRAQLVALELLCTSCWVLWMSTPNHTRGKLIFARRRANHSLFTKVRRLSLTENLHKTGNLLRPPRDLGSYGSRKPVPDQTSSKSHKAKKSNR